MVIIDGIKKGLGIKIRKKLGHDGAPDPKGLYGIYQVRTRFNRKTQVKEVFYVPTNPQTEAQQAHRQEYGKLVETWRGLTDERKDYYNKLKEPEKISGYNRYIRTCMLTPSGPDCPVALPYLNAPDIWIQMPLYQCASGFEEFTNAADIWIQLPRT